MSERNRKSLMVSLAFMGTALKLREEMQTINWERMLDNIQAASLEKFGRRDIPTTLQQTLDEIFDGNAPTPNEIFNWKSELVPVVDLTKDDEQSDQHDLPELDRASALLIARKILERRTFGAATIESWTVGDLLAVADWMLNGVVIDEV